LAKVKANETLSLPGDRETINQLGRAVNNIVQYGLPEDYYETYPAKVKAVTLADIESIEKRVLQPDHLVWVVIGDRSKIEAGVRELGLGEIHLLTADGEPM
jgi:zinc protease